VTTRSVKKSRETIAALRKHTKKFAASSKALESRYGGPFDPHNVTKRVHVLSVQVDLCDLPGVYRSAAELVSGTLSSASDDDAFISVEDVAVPRLDAVIFNAGIGGWIGFSPLRAVYSIIVDGLANAVTYPNYKIAVKGLTVDPLAKSKSAQDTKGETLGEVFCANIFGHYLLAHELLPLLRRPVGSSLEPGRIIWETSVEPVWKDLSMDDFQGLETLEPYETSKRVMDMMVLSANLPQAKPYSSAYLGVAPAGKKLGSKANEPDAGAGTLPKMYLCHPGIVLTTIVIDNPILIMATWFLFIFARLFGSPWHPISPYKGATASVWMALQEQESLDAAHAERSKWGSSTDIWGEERVKKTEVEGWGWEGVPEDLVALKAEKAIGGARKIVGRRPGVKPTTPEMLAEFEVLGAEVWREMEKLRAVWEPRIKAALV
jgi:3-keto steroid reductase